MASSRQLVLLIVALAVVAVSATNFRAGTRVAGDRLACSGRVDIRGVYNKIVTATRICDLSVYRMNVTQVLAFDRGLSGRGGYASITKGGPGYNNVSLYFWSQKSQPLNFTIEVYGKARY
ncbi:hypothetical protein TSAR_008032 [Trichomalopsis sarcophagae]|uniref:Salivary secreted peptide n=1 Tax=Trichomalopsis sarcophagae TaxID=543379 RepID=A0A232EW24_9HYME|nr:hypothetical protein TSAR_008032 [Trichomalopsis sarcophagae]